MHEGSFLKKVCFQSLLFLLWKKVFGIFAFILSCFCWQWIWKKVESVNRFMFCCPSHNWANQSSNSWRVDIKIHSMDMKVLHLKQKHFFSLKIWQKMMAFIKPVEDIVPPCWPSGSSDTDVIKSSKRCHHWNLCQVCVGINRHQTSNADVVVIQCNVVQCNVMQWGIVFGPVDQI